MPWCSFICAIVFALCIQTTNAYLVATPTSLSFEQNYGSQPVQAEVTVSSTAPAAQDLSYSFASKPRQDVRRLEEVPKTYWPNTSRRFHGSSRIKKGMSSRFLFSWKTPTSHSVHARRLQEAGAIASSAGAGVQVFPALGVGILFDGSHKVMRRLQSSLFGIVGSYELDQTVHLFSFSDPLFAEQWALQSVRFKEAIVMANTRLQDRDREIVVAVIDSGVQVDHPDLEGQLWTNKGEIKNNMIDDDGNGKIDDVHGWDFVSDSVDISDLSGHGTHCAGIIGAVANNGKGIVGLAEPSHAKLMILKFASGEGGSLSDAISALNYAVEQRASISSMSFGGTSWSAVFARALESAAKYGHVVVAAAGNDALDIDHNVMYPCAYQTGNVICVAATNKYDRIVPFSNYGIARVHLAAPGYDIVSTINDGKYAARSGTSMATPYVSAALAFLAAAFPHLGLMYLKTILLKSVRKIAGMKVIHGGVLDLEAAVQGAFAVTWAKVLQAPSFLGGTTQSATVLLELGLPSTLSPLPEGKHTSSLQLVAHGNEISSSAVTLDLSLTIHGTPKLQFEQALDFKQVVVNSMAQEKFVISNAGNGTAEIDVKITDGVDAFALGAATILVPPGTEAPLMVSCLSDATGAIAGTLYLEYSWTQLPGGTRRSSHVISLLANVTTPPVLHLERWSGVTLLQPQELSQQLASAPAEWHRGLISQDSLLVAELATPPSSQRLACEALDPSPQYTGGILLVARGDCWFITKVRHCQDVGAVGVLVVNNVISKPNIMGAPKDVGEDEMPTIPAFHISWEDGQKLEEFLQKGSTISLEFRLQPVVIRPLHDQDWRHFQLPISNRGGSPLDYSIGLHADASESTGSYDVEIARDSNGIPLPTVWRSLAEDTQVQYFADQDTGNVFIEFPAPVPFSGGLVRNGRLSLDGLLLLEPDFVPIGSFVPWLGPEYAPRALIAPYWDDLFCSTLCKIRQTITRSETDESWTLIVQFENVHVIAPNSIDWQTVTFQFLLHHDGTIEIAYFQWPDLQFQQFLAIGIEGFDDDAFPTILNNHRLGTSLPWQSGEPFAVRMRPWLIPKTLGSTMGRLQPSETLQLQFQLRMASGDKQAWMDISATDNHESIDATKKVRVVIRTAVSFNIEMPTKVFVCGSPAIITVSARSRTGKLSKGEEGNVILGIDTGQGKKNITVLVMQGVGTVTLENEIAGTWNLELEDKFQTGLDVSNKTVIQWVSGIAQSARIHVGEYQVAGIAFSIGLRFLDVFGNLATPSMEQIPSDSVTIRWQASTGLRGAVILPTASDAHVVQLEFATPQVVQFWPDALPGASSIDWNDAVNITVLPHLYEFFTTDWGSCSELCGTGYRERQVICRPLQNTDSNASHFDSSGDCRGLEKPVDKTPCSPTCMRGDCVEAVPHTCTCFTGFVGKTCTIFEGCPSGMYAVKADANAAIPDLCQGVKCDNITSERGYFEVTNQGYFPSNASFTCPQGQVLVGPPMAMCLESGRWDFGNNAPDCHGPELQHFTCTLGSQCSLKVTGKGLGPQNHMLLLRDATSCLASDAKLSNLISGTTSSSDVLQSFVLDQVTIAADAVLTPAQYVLCWTQSLQTKSRGEVAFVGYLSVVGPLPKSLACVLGMECSTVLHGFGLDPSSNKVWISPESKCKDDCCESHYPDWPTDGAHVSFLASSSSLLVKWGVALEGDVLDQQSLCWRNDSSSPPVTVGQFAMQGPQQNGEYTCTFGTPCSVNLEGVGFSLADVVAISMGESCSIQVAFGPVNASAMLRSGHAMQFQFGELASFPGFDGPVMEQSKGHAVCWMAPSSSAQFVRVGFIQFRGPSVDTLSTCTLGANCTVNLIGNRFQLLDLVQLCSLDDIDFKKSVDGRQFTTVSAGKASYYLGVATSAPSIRADSYGVCWGDAFSTAASVFAGSLRLNGPDTGVAHQCELAYTCALTIRGYGLALSNQIYLRLDGECNGAQDRRDLGTFAPDDPRQSPETRLLFNLGILKFGYVQRAYTVCWQHSPTAKMIDIGTLTLAASPIYLRKASEDAMHIFRWVSGYLSIYTAHFDLTRQEHHAAIISALAQTLDVLVGHVHIETITGRRLERLLVQDVKTTIYYEIESANAASSNAMSEVLEQAADGGDAAQRFAETLTGLAPDAHFSYAVFDTHWIDVAVIENGLDHASENKYPFGLRWWPKSMPEMLLGGVVSVSVILFLFVCGWCLIMRPWNNYKSRETLHQAPRATRIVPSASPRANRSLSSVPRGRNHRPPSRASPKIAARRPSQDTLIGRSIPDDIPRQTQEQERCLGMLLDMGFDYDSAASALHAHNFQVDRAVQSLTAHQRN